MRKNCSVTLLKMVNGGCYHRYSGAPFCQNDAADSEGNMYDLIIIGSGPAGLGAAIYATRAKLGMIVLEQNYVSGGQIINTYEVDNYPGLPGISGFDLADKMRGHAEKLGAEFVTAEVTDFECDKEIKRVTADGKVYEAKTVIIATGASHKKLGVPGEEELSGKGVSYCATCDGAFFRNRDVAVMGGGNVAVEDAIFLARTCRKVYVVHRRDELRADKVLQDSLFSMPNVEMVWSSVIKEIEGTDSVTDIIVESRKDGSQRRIGLNGVFIAVGIEPLSSVFAGKLDTDEAGYIKADESCETSIPGVYAAGDVRTKQLRQVVTAVSDGACAVTSVQHYLLKH